MNNFFIKYNPYTVETLMIKNGQTVTEMSKLYRYRFERLQLWLDKLIPILLEEFNDDHIKITFHGTLLDFEDLKLQCDEYTEVNSNTTIELEHIESKASTDRFNDLAQLFEYMQQECPFDDLKDNQIKENFYKALSSEFEVSVIATMSSGKSTLINAMLQRELMPAKNEACTSTIARIKDVDGKTNFTAVCRNQHQDVISQHNDVTLETMQQLNNTPDVSYIDIEGDIPFITSKSVELVLLDTPGPNNSRSEDHRDHTYRIIKEKTKPMVLYVLNATQLATNDDNKLLRAVAEAMKVGGKQSKDRFIFALNKIDTFDIEGDDSISDTLQNVKDYLSKHGIENPNIYPTSAEMAKVIRLNNRGYNLTNKQRSKLGESVFSNDDSRMHLSNYAPLSQQSKDNIQKMIQAARVSQDPYAEALVHTGLPAVEIAINEYMDKYALTAKVKAAVDTFRKKVEEKQLFSVLLDSLKENQLEKEELSSRLLKVEKQLNDGKLAETFRTRIKQLNMTTEADARVTELRSKISKTLKRKGDWDRKMSPASAEQFMLKLSKDVGHLESDVRTDLETLIDDVVIGNATKLIQEYEKYIHSLLEDETMDKGAFSTNVSLSFLVATLPDADELIRNHKFSEDVKVGEKEVSNPKREGFFGKFKFWQPKTVTRSVYESKDFVDQEDIYNSFVRKITGDFNENINRAKEQANQRADELREYFIQEFNKLDEVLKQKVNELQQLNNNLALLDQKIEENQYKKAWLTEFINKLNLILDI